MPRTSTTPPPFTYTSDDTDDERSIVRPGDRLRLSTRLLIDLYAMPEHESCTVTFVRAERAPDGALVLVLAHAEVPS